MSIDLRKVAMSASLAVAVVMLVGKFAAYLITDSVAILSDAAESVIHIAATGIAAVSLWYSLQPASPRHLYGFGKIAYFSAGLEGALIVCVAAAVLYSSFVSLTRGPTLSHLGYGLAITGGLALVNLALGTLLVRVGRAYDSLVLVANGQHVLTDMWTSMAVVGGVGVVGATGLTWLDPVVAIAVAGRILGTGVGLARQAFHGLIETTNPEHTRTIVACLETARSEGWLSAFHQLRHREVADEIWIEVHLLVPGSLTVEAAHRKVTELEHRVRDALPKEKVHMTSHIEPSAHDAHHPRGHAGLHDALKP
jgi:cation diffusion facilitator family transporter